MKALLTGGAGFSGSYLADVIHDCTDWDLIVLDCLTYAGKMENLAHVAASPRFKFIRHDFSEPLTADILKELEGVDFIIHLGAATHVTNSLSDPMLFLQSNVNGTVNLLEAARVLKPRRFLYVSTDEVFGASTEAHKESDSLCPSNPYSASKAAGEMWVTAYQKCFRLPTVITRTSNMYGANQNKEKFVPMTLGKIKDGKPIVIHADANGNVGSRQWIHASDQARAILFLLEHGEVGETYHVSGERRTNKEVALALGADPKSIQVVNAFEQFHGHDLHYAIEDSKLRGMGWQPRVKFEEWAASQ